MSGGKLKKIGDHEDAAKEQNTARGEQAEWVN